MSVRETIAGLRCTSQTRDLPTMTAEEFARHAHDLAAGNPHVILLSGDDHACSRRSIALLHPAARLSVKNGAARLDMNGSTRTERNDPFTLLNAAHGTLSRIADASSVLVGGYVAYEAAHAIEDVPSTAADSLALPDLFFLWPTVLLQRDHEDGRVRLLEIAWTSNGEPLVPLEKEPPDQSDRNGPVMTPLHRLSTQAAELRRSANRKEYEDSVDAVRQHIYDGDVYQVNLSQRFSFPLREDPFVLWMRLFAENPAPFFAYVDAGSHQVISTSMERLFLIDGKTIESRPIKGTRPRGCSESEDAALAEELRTSAKDDAELSMIVDLVRNDCSRVCEAGTVEVAEHKRLERYTNVQHLVSVVRGRLRAGTGIADVFRALFPGGSITGCPKIRSMSIIDALERETRHVYTGSIGYIASDGRADFSIAIRTAAVKDGMCHLSVGGGIVYDSDPVEEYIETLHKGGSFFRLAGITTE